MLLDKMATMKSLLCMSFSFGVLILFFAWNNVKWPTLSQHDVFGVKQLCTHKWLRFYYQENQYFPSAGHWQRSTDNSSDFFRPRDCYFSDLLVRTPTVARCMIAANISYIVVLGDSNGRHNFEALVSLIGQKNCHQGAEQKASGDNNKVNTNNTSRMDGSWFGPFTIDRKVCRSCVDRIVRCQLRQAGQSKSITLEYMGMTRSMEFLVSVAGEKLVTNNRQQLYLKYYLKDNYPDVLIIFPPFNHDKTSKTTVNRRELKQLTYMVQMYVPKTTKVFYMPAFSEFESKRKSAVYINKTYHGFLAAPKINWLNHQLYQTLESEFLHEQGNVYGFFDMFAISKSRENFSTDGVHMIDSWYQNEMSMFLQLFCNSVYNKAF